MDEMNMADIMNRLLDKIESQQREIEELQEKCRRAFLRRIDKNYLSGE